MKKVAGFLLLGILLISAGCGQTQSPSSQSSTGGSNPVSGQVSRNDMQSVLTAMDELQRQGTSSPVMTVQTQSLLNPQSHEGFVDALGYRVTTSESSSRTFSYRSVLKNRYRDGNRNVIRDDGSLSFFQKIKYWDTIQSHYQQSSQLTATGTIETQTTSAESSASGPVSYTVVGTTVSAVTGAIAGQSSITFVEAGTRLTIPTFTLNFAISSQTSRVDVAYQWQLAIATKAYYGDFSLTWSYDPVQSSKFIVAGNVYLAGQRVGILRLNKTQTAIELVLTDGTVLALN